MGEFTMPSLGADMDEGTLTEWLVAPGDTVAKGQVVAVIETAKSDIEIECFESGTVVELLAEPGAVLPVGAPLAIIGAGDAAVVKTAAPDPVPPQVPAEVMPEIESLHNASVSALQSAAEPQIVPGPSETRAAPYTAAEGAGPLRIEAGPLVRHLATERGIDLAAVHGTGRGGRVTRADIEHARPVEQPPQDRAVRVRATPYARRLADELDLDLAGLRGSGENGAVRADDVKAAHAARAAAPVPVSVVQEPAPDRVRDPGPARTREPSPETSADRRSAAMRRAIADLMARSKREIPHYYLATTIDLAAATQWLHTRNRALSPSRRLVPAALLLKATALATRRVPELNGYWQNDSFAPGEGVHLAVAVSLRGGGLLTPVIKNADTLPPGELMDSLKDLVQRARKGRLRASEVSGATLTVTNLGDQGTESVYGVIHSPQVALVGFGAVVERPWAVNGLLGVRPVVTATLCADHRATDGAIGARFLTAVDRLLQNPEELS
ncbi:dihydrolipoamide acetyltransferase family protein [Streptomyces sp. N35]|uniref:dihydrolipoamide acetyltransferase family protein n=1 Tax=Streptomyces sp. N35 TaxID=2795730 RepID=UPI0018F3920D|nr:dihydrolipoamide acetyltransferase family protein [Streptomyces sp. N35]